MSPWCSADCLWAIQFSTGWRINSDPESSLCLLVVLCAGSFSLHPAAGLDWFWFRRVCITFPLTTDFWLFCKIQLGYYIAPFRPVKTRHRYPWAFTLIYYYSLYLRETLNRVRAPDALPSQLSLSCDRLPWRQGGLCHIAACLTAHDCCQHHQNLKMVPTKHHFWNKMICWWQQQRVESTQESLIHELFSPF